MTDWRNAETDPPSAGDLNCTLLIVKELKSGERTITFGSFSSSEYDWVNGRWIGHWNMNNGKGIVRYWMPLPKIPTDGEVCV